VDWNYLCQAALGDPGVMADLRRVAGYELNLESPYDGQCYHEWREWVQDPGREAWVPNLTNCGGV